MDKDQVQLRDATLDDVEQIAEIWRHYVSTSTANLEESPPTTQTVRQDLEVIFAKGYPFIAAVEGGTLCGYAYIGSFNDRSGYRFCCEDSIYLLESHAGKGLGKRMLETLIQRLKTEGITTQVLAKISLPAEAALQDIPSCRLHMAAGFYEAGRLKKVGRKFDQWLDVVILQLDLSESS